MRRNWYCSESNIDDLASSVKEDYILLDLTEISRLDKLY